MKSKNRIVFGKHIPTVDRGLRLTIIGDITALPQTCLEHARAVQVHIGQQRHHRLLRARLPRDRAQVPPLGLCARSQREVPVLRERVIYDEWGR